MSQSAAAPSSRSAQMADRMKSRLRSRSLPLSPSMRSRHRAATLRAATAHVRAVPHDVVVSVDRLARLGAALARIGADAAHRGVQLGASEHEVARCVAGLGAVEQSRDVLGSGMRAAPSETVHQRLDADVVAVRAVVDALAHLARDVLRPEVVGHEKSPFLYV